MNRIIRGVFLSLLAGLVTGTAGADPWLAPGDESIRHDIQLLADAGILRGPVTTWPLSWPDIARDALDAGGGGLDEATSNALMRIQRLSRIASTRGGSGLGYRASAAIEPVTLRHFADTPREEGEVAVRASWLTDHFTVNAQGAVVAEPDDDKSVRADGSYVGINVGNFMLSAGLMERWWGPGWDGSLIMSTNARPIPSVTLERNYTDPFKTRWLSWIGPWRASIAVGQTEGHDVAVPDVRFLAARVNIKPRPWLELAVTRTAQFCGGGRPCDFSTFKNLLVGRDNRSDSLGPQDEPGNQMAGYDLRLRSPWRVLPLAVSMQLIGEDEAGGLPSKFLGMFGAELWGSTSFGGYRLRVEYADTACSFSREQPQFDCGYRNSVYPQGYAHRGRIVGHSMDNDSRMYSIAALLVRPRGDVASVAVRRYELNRDGGAHAISEVPVTLDNVELRYSRGLGIGKITAGLGYDDPVIGRSAPGSGLRGYLLWQQGF